MRCLLLVVVVACSPAPRASSSPPPVAAAGSDAAPLDASIDARLDAPIDAPTDALVDAAPAKKYAKRGEVCRRSPPHAANAEQLKPIACEPGLRCCNPCGIQGCDDICMRPAQCFSRP